MKYNKSDALLATVMANPRKEKKATNSCLK
jgi:hypothetical protein